MFVEIKINIKKGIESLYIKNDQLQNIIKNPTSILLVVTETMNCNINNH